MPRCFQTLLFVLTDWKEILNTSHDFQRGLKGSGGPGRWVIDKIFHPCPSSPLCSVPASALPSPYQGQGTGELLGVVGSFPSAWFCQCREEGALHLQTSVMDFQRATPPYCAWQIHPAEVLYGMGCSSFSINMHPYKGLPIICTIFFVKHLDEGITRGRYFYEADDTFNTEWTALNPLTFHHESESGMR